MTGGIVVFAGPTLSPADVRSTLEATVLPPAAQGDVYRASLESPWAVALVDGYFERVPAVWHKEILWALAHGIHVFGAASMGALRAAELAAFGMVGVGRIFEAFHDGALTDDDEVAVRHHPAEAGFVAVSEAMVNIRATVARAVDAGIVMPGTAEAMVAAGKRLHYAERSYPAVVTLARAEHAEARDLQRFESWLPEGRVDQKRLDGLELLQHVGQVAARGRTPLTVTFHFEHTEMWEHVGRVANAPAGHAAADPDGALHALADEVRLAYGAAASQVFERAFARAVALEEAGRQRIRPSAAQVAAAVTASRTARGLRDEATFDAWRDANGLTHEAYRDAAADEVRLQQVRLLYARDLDSQLPAVLRDDDTYRRLTERAGEKRETLRRHGVDTLGRADSGLTDDALIRWYFEELRGEPLPADLEAAATRAGVSDADALLRMLLREWWYRKLAAPPGPAPEPGAPSTAS